MSESTSMLAFNFPFIVKSPTTIPLPSVAVFAPRSVTSVVANFDSPLTVNDHIDADAAPKLCIVVVPRDD